MNPYLMEQIAGTHGTDLRTQNARSRPSRAASHARRARQALAHQGHPHHLRRRTGWALVSLGERLAYTPGEE
jgi:hypothetical protein